MDHVDWREQLPLDNRLGIVNKILETLKKHLTYFGQEGLQELENIAVRCEENVYSAATSQSDYLRTISLKICNIQNAMANFLQTGDANASRNPSDLESSGQLPQNSSAVRFLNDNWRGSRAQMVQPQAGTTQQSAILSSASASPVVLDGWRAQVPLEYRDRITNEMLETLKKHLPYSGQEGLQELRKIAVRFEEKIYSAATSESDYQRKISLKMLTMETKSQSPMANSLQTVAADASRNSSDLASDSMQSQFQDLGLTMPIVGGQSQGSQNMRNNISVAGVQNSGSSASTLPAVSNPTQGAVGQNSNLQNNSNVAKESVMKQKLQPGGMTQPMLQSHAQKQHQNLIQTGQIQSSQQAVRQPTMMQSASLSGLQQNHQSSPMSQLNNIANLQQQLLMSQLNNVPKMHQPQLGGGVSGLQQSMVLGKQSNASSGMPSNQHSVHMLQQNVPVQQKMQQSVSLVQNQTPQPQPQPFQQQMASQSQPQSGQMPHLQLQSNSLQHDMQQWPSTSGAMLQQQILAEQQKQFFQSQQATKEASTNSTAQTENSGAGDWQEEVYQKIKSMKDEYLLGLNEMHAKIAATLQPHADHPEQPTNEQRSRLKFSMVILERLIQILRLSKDEIQKDHKDKLDSVERQITNILNAGRTRKPVSLQPGQLPQAGTQNSQPQSQISHVQTQPLNPQTSAATTAQNNSSALYQNTSSSVPSISNPLINSLQQPSFSFGLGQNSSPLSPQIPQTGIQNSHPQSQISHVQQTQPLNPQTCAATTTQNNLSALHQNTSSSVPSISNSLMNAVQLPSSSFGLGQNSSLISPQQVAVNSLQRNIATNGVNALQPNLNSSSLQTYSGLLQNPYLNPQLEHMLQMQQMWQQKLQYQLLMKMQPSARLPGHPSPQTNQQNLVTSLIKTEKPLHSANSSVVVPAPSTPVAPSPMHGESEKVNASPSSHPSTNTGHLQAPNDAESPALSLAPGHPSPQINQQNSVTSSLTKTGTPLHTADSPVIVPSPSTPIAPFPVHVKSEKVNASLSSHPDTDTAPNVAGSSALPVKISITNTNTGHLKAPNAAGSSVLPLSISIGESEIVSASLSSQPNTHIIHLQAPNPAGSSAKPLAISITITIA